MTEDFTYASYRHLLLDLRSRGYEVRGFNDSDPKEKHLVLRHDIDMSLDLALPIAKIEYEIGVKATYFIMLRTEMYNPYSAKGSDAINKIAQYGHDIGLHMDPSLYNSDERSLQMGAATECGMLEILTKRSVESVSFHRPAKEFQGYEPALAGRVHAYQPKYFKEMGYCSDSRGNWNFGHPLEHDSVKKGSALQLLTHPIWWSEQQLAPEFKLRRFLSERCEFLDLELSSNCSVHIPGTYRSA